MSSGDAGGASSGIDAYEVVGTLGKGSFGVVSKVRRKSDGRVCSHMSFLSWDYAVSAAAVATAVVEGHG